MSMTRALAAICVAPATLAGCDDGPATVPKTMTTDDPADAFVGVWHYDDALGQNVCPGYDPVPATPIGNKHFGHGIAHELTDLTVSTLDDEAYCNFGFAVDGMVATG